MGTSVFRIRTAVDFPPVLKSDAVVWGLASTLGRPDSFKPRLLVDQSPLRDTASAYRDRPTEPATPSTTSQRGDQRTSATDRQRRNPHSV